MTASGITLRSVVGTALSLSIGDGAEAIAGNTLQVYRVRGHEAISKPFRYEIEFVRNGAVLSSGEVLGKNATLEIGVTDAGATTPGGGMMSRGTTTHGNEMARRIHGVVDGFMVEEKVDDDHKTQRLYRVALVPRLAMLARNRQNRIHATSAPQTLEQIIERKLRSSAPDHEPDEEDDRVVLEAGELHIAIDTDIAIDRDTGIDIDPGIDPDIHETENPLTNLSHVAQYDETDLDFVRRLCERHGVYFFFASNAGDAGDAEDTRGVVVFANTNDPFGVIRFETGAGGGPYKKERELDIELVLTGSTGLTGWSTFIEADGGPAKLEAALFGFRSVRRSTPAHLHMVTADRETGAGPTATLDGEVLGIHTARGIYTDYDTHFPTRTAGAVFANIRSQELGTANNYFIGSTNSPCVAPGRTFTKKPPGNPSPAPGTTYPRFLVTAVEIEVTHAHADGICEVDGEAIQTAFGNRFRCIGFSGVAPTEMGTKCVFRPPRETPIPRVPGVQTAYIGTGARGAGGRPDPDADGAYRIYSQVLDERARSVGPGDEGIDRLSKAVRKGEPYAGKRVDMGPAVGMHFALKRDTEVLVAFRNGDPDRPVIAAAMPGSPDHESPVTSANPTSHVIRTSSGARFEIHDDVQDSRARIALQSREADDRASYMRLGRSATASAPEALEDHYEKNVIAVEENELDGIALYAAGDIHDSTRKDRITEAKGSVRVRAGKDIHGRSVERHLLRGRPMVIVSGGAAAENDGGDEVGVGDDEVPIEDDDMLLSSEGNVYIKADGDLHTTALKSVTTAVTGDEVGTTSGDTVTHHYGSTFRYVRGSAWKLVAGGDFGYTVGAAALGRLGGWLAVLGDAGGEAVLRSGASAVWPQLALPPRHGDVHDIHDCQRQECELREQVHERLFVEVTRLGPPQRNRGHSYQQLLGQ